MDQKIIELYDRFTHGGLNRRDFMARLAWERTVSFFQRTLAEG